MKEIYGTILYLINWYQPSKCPLCSHPNKALTTYNSINNPYIARCSNAKCRKIIFLKEGTFFANFPRTPISNILFIINLWLIQNNNETEIYNRFKNDFPNINISLIHITDIIHKLREYIVHQLKDIYAIEDISIENGMRRYAIDEYNFVSESVTTWVIGIIDIVTRKIRLEYVDNRNTDTIKKLLLLILKEVIL